MIMYLVKIQFIYTKNLIQLKYIKILKRHGTQLRFNNVDEFL